MPLPEIISLVPSLTELLFDLGLGHSVAGRTRFCIHPEDEVQKIPIVGGTKNPRIDKIMASGPGLILANKEENRKEDIERLQPHFEVLLTEIDSVESALFAIFDIGRRCGAEEKAEQLIRLIQHELKQIPDEPPLSTAYFIWKDPWMSIGRDTYIHSVMSRWNLVNVYSGYNRYPKTSLEELSALRPELILLSSEPYPFKEKHIREVKRVCPQASVVPVDGEWFSWYGSRMLPSFKHLNTFRKAIG